MQTPPKQLRNDTTSSKHRHTFSFLPLTPIPSSAALLEALFKV